LSILILSFYDLQLSTKNNIPTTNCKRKVNKCIAMKALTPYDNGKPKQRKQTMGALRSFVLPLTSGAAFQGCSGGITTAL
jgi:hypothetical protein